jgi:acetoin utilization protein AcuB
MMRAVKRMPSLAVVMTPFPHAIERGASLAEAQRMMEEHAFRHLPVVSEEGALVGIVSQRALSLARSLRGDDSAALTVADVARPEPYVVDIRTSLDEVVEGMAAIHAGSALVVKNDKLVGILTDTDVAKMLTQTLRELYPPPVEDEPA